MMKVDDIPPMPCSKKEIQKRFDQLQQKLIPLWKSIQQFNQDEQTIVVIPSLTVDYPLEGSVLEAYEERFLFLLLLLRQPRARLIYVTSQVIYPAIVEYYLGLLPGVIASHARKRLILITPQDASPQPLSAKLLKRPRLIEKIRAHIPDLNRAHLLPFNTTHLERDLALRLGIPMYGADPKFFPLGTKSGCRKIFAEVGVDHPLGVEDLMDIKELTEAVLDICRQHPRVRQVIVKLNEGVSGDGNAVVSLEGLAADDVNKSRVRKRIEKMTFESSDITLDAYLEKLKLLGGIVEERIVAEEIRSPSVQLRITPLGRVEVLSTHDQMLGGPSGQSFLGSRFPADKCYAADIAHQSLKVGEYLSREGVLGRFAIDFVTAHQNGVWQSHAIELNLRKGGTTHPFLTLQFLTDGIYDAEKTEFITPQGKGKCFIASDHIESPLYRSLCPEEIFDISVRHQLHFNHTLQTGVVFHMMSALGDHGRMGFTAVEDSHHQADMLFKKTVDILDMEAGEALKKRPLPDID